MSTKTNQNRLTEIIMLVIILVLMAIGAYLYVQKPKPDTIYITKYATKIDTTYKHDTTKLVITKPVLKTIYKEKIDTIILTQAFEKTIDTTLPNAHLEVTYMFPQDSFKIWLQTQTIEITKTDTVSLEVKIPSTENKYDKWLYGGVGVVGGIILGVIIAK